MTRSGYIKLDAYLLIGYSGLLTPLFAANAIQLSLQIRGRLGDIGLLYTVLSMGYVLGALPTGELLDRGLTKAVLLVSLLAFTGLLFFIPQVSSFWALVILVTFFGAFRSAISVVGNASLALADKNRAASNLNLLHIV
uniref:Major Facilitator Superfamily protein n=1 Tax=Candidatus Kentrum sp. FW TaxID=2126338 RepID=A0A450TXS2_9GAMM|nr:MAG: Major Facilitator Superfamily protein [Candidatus Kentron sp. FW]